MKFVWKYVRPHAGLMTLGLITKFLGTLMDLFLPYILAHVIDDVTPQGNTAKILIWGAVMVVCSAGAWVCNIHANRTAAAVARNTTRALRDDLFCKSSFLSNAQIDKWTVPSLISRMTTDTHYIHRTVGAIQRMGIRAPVLVLGGIVMTLALDPVLCLVMCSLMPIMFAVIFFVSRKGLPMFDKLQLTVDKMVRVVRENATGVRVIKALSRVDAEKERFYNVNREVMRDEKRANMTMGITHPCTSLILNTGLVLVVIVGAFRVNKGLSEPGAIVAFLTYFTIILNAMFSVTRMITMCSQMIASANRVEAVMNEQPALLPEPQTPCDSKSFIEMRHVTFSYNGKRDNIHDINFTIEKGQTLGILGATGSGKSTIASLLLRLYDATSGNIYIDGRDVRQYELPELRSKFGVVFQNDMLFDDTADGNIKLWRDISAEDVDRAIDIAHADFIKEEGVDKHIAARGANISGGQKQRLLIARALAGKPQILILDDSSSALDYRTDAAVRSEIHKQFADTTTIIIAQRISSIRSCDKILVLERGVPYGLGTHEELMKNCDLYAEIAKLQMGEGEIE